MQVPGLLGARVPRGLQNAIRTIRAHQALSIERQAERLGCFQALGLRGLVCGHGHIILEQGGQGAGSRVCGGHLEQGLDARVPPG